MFQRAYEVRCREAASLIPQRRNEFQLNDSAPYFLSHVRRIGADGWLPNDQDILQSRVVTTGITESFFNVGKERWRVTDVCACLFFGIADAHSGGQVSLQTAPV